MAGHSKWANIQHRKGRQDEKRGKIWTKLIKEITVAAKLGGGDVATNPRLRLAIDKAKDSNMPNDNVQRAIQRGTGMNGAAIIVDCLTDNRTRTVAEVRHAFNKNGGNMGAEGSVAFLFKHCGQMLFAPGISEDQLMEVALDAGAEDVITHDDGSLEVLSPVPDFSKVQDAISQAGLKPELATVAMRPETEIALEGEQAESMQKLLDALENLDDVQEVFTNAAL
jgi:YebC/PmpR family DNA-binding regulatory protein